MYDSRMYICELMGLAYYAGTFYTYFSDYTKSTLPSPSPPITLFLLILLFLLPFPLPHLLLPHLTNFPMSGLTTNSPLT